ncbi:MAG: hypothetical protein JWM09_853 [Francisellaceae bacterium]|nr:hypothetical protein [Francisellaceae bacterium]
MKQIGLVYITSFLMAIGIEPTPVKYLSAGNFKVSHQDFTTQNKSIGLSSKFDQSVLYKLLLAEFALERNLPQEGLLYYSEAAAISQDPEMAKLASQLAIQLDNEILISQNLERWAFLSPNNALAQLSACIFFLEHDAKKAYIYLLKFANLTPPNIIDDLSYAQINLPLKSQILLKNLFIKMAKDFPFNLDIQFMAAQGMALDNDFELSKPLLEQILIKQPSHSYALMLEAKIIMQEQGVAQSLEFLSKKTEQYPYLKTLKLFYIQSLINNNHQDKALAILATLNLATINHPQDLLLLADIYLILNHLSQAKNTFLKVLAYPTAVNTAKYFLGKIEEETQNYPQALKYYLSVESGIFKMDAFIRAAYILQLAQRYEEAIVILNNISPLTYFEKKQIFLAKVNILIEMGELKRAYQEVTYFLQKHNNDINLLFTRSFIALKLTQYDKAENDLLKVIHLEPQNSEALDTLAFILSHNPNRFKDALRYLNEALLISPNNPRYIGTMGWLQYRMGNLDIAISFLSKARQLSNDPTIAAHLGEVLWIKGNKKEALKIWGIAIQTAPNASELLDTLGRFNIPAQGL